MKKVLIVIGLLVIAGAVYFAFPAYNPFKKTVIDYDGISTDTTYVYELKKPSRCCWSEQQGIYRLQMQVYHLHLEVQELREDLNQ